LRTTAAYRTLNGRGHLYRHRKQHLCQPCFFNTPHQFNASFTISHTTPHLLPADFFALLSFSHSEPWLAQTGFPIPPRSLTTPHFPLSANERKKEKKTKKPLHSWGRQRGKQNVPRKQHGGGFSMVLFVPRRERDRRTGDLAVFLLQVAH